MSDLLSIGTSGLLAAQNALDTIGNNIANASTPGYSRQVTLLDTLPSTQIGNSFSGSGVYVQGTQRIVNNFVTQSLWAQQSNLNQYQSFNDIMSQMDMLLADPSLGVTDGLSNVFSALQEISNDPGSIPARQIFITQTQVLQNRLNELNAQIYNQYNNINTQIIDDISAINSLSQQIAEINFQIQNLGSNNFSSAPNELLDTRENLILNLSQYVSVSTFSQNNGAVNVFIGNGQSLVVGNQALMLSPRPDPTNAINTNIVTLNGSFTQDITDSFQGGDIGGLIDIRDNILPLALNSIGRVAISIAMTFNDQHKKGLDLNGNIGTDLFNDPNAYNAVVGRSISSSTNTGTAVFGVTIDPINATSEISTEFSDASNIVTAGTLTALVNGMLAINGINVRSTTASDDTVSTTDNLGSAIAISNAINSQSANNLVTAYAQPTVAYLGAFTPGALVAGNLTINGVSVISTGINEEILLQDINALTTQTGITAIGDGNSNITLVAQDGRNIEIAKTVNSAAATFSYFDMSAGGPLDNVVRASIKLVSDQVGSIVIAGFSPNAVGFTAGSDPQTFSSLTTNDYQLAFDGSNYTLTRLPDMTIVGISGSPNFSLDGFTINLQSGVASAGDSFSIQPTRNGARDFTYTISDPLALAMALPVIVDSALENKGSAQISVTEITDTTGTPLGTSTRLGNAFSKAGQLTPPIRIEFTTATSYIIYDISGGLPGTQIGPEQQYSPTSIANDLFPISGVVDTTPPGPNTTYVYDPGYRISIAGAAQMGDTFTIGYSFNPVGDNRNGLLLANFQFSKTMVNNSASFQDAYTQFVGTIGGQASQAQINLDSGQSIMQSMQSQRNSISGVNIDEEATNLLQYEQAYQATAQVIVVAKGVFDALLRAIGGY